MKANLPLAILMLSTLALAACSSDEDNSPSDPGGGDPADTIAPTVTAVQPPEDSTLQPGVVITIEFSEAMDTSVDLVSHVLASHGGFADIAWQGESALTLSFETLPQDTQIFLGLDMSLTDKAGNSLEEPYVIYYQTWSEI